MKTVAYLLQSKLSTCASFFFLLRLLMLLPMLFVFCLKFSFFQLARGDSSGDKEDFTGRTNLSKDETETCTWSRIMCDV